MVSPCSPCQSREKSTENDIPRKLIKESSVFSSKVSTSSSFKCISMTSLPLCLSYTNSTPDQIPGERHGLKVYSKECGHALLLNPHTTSNTEENHTLHTRLCSLAECYLMMICRTRCLQYAQLVNIAISSCLVSPIPIFAVHTIDYNHPHQWKIIRNETWNIHFRGYFHNLLLQVDISWQKYHLISERPMAWYPWLKFSFLFVFRIHLGKL